MATAVETTASTTNHHRENHLTSDALSLIDLRLLSQSELLSLSLSSSFSLRNSRNDAVISSLRIDPSTFNESAGSRKQTFFRLRLLSPGSQPPVRRQNQLLQAQPLNEDVSNSQLISLFKTLIGSDSQSFETVQDENYDDDNQLTDELYDVPVGNADFGFGYETERLVLAGNSHSVSQKRKRGRPRKNENLVFDVGKNDSVGLNKDIANKEIVRENVEESKQGIGGIVSVNEKKKRGRPRKNEIVVFNVVKNDSDSKELEVVNKDNENMQIVVYENVEEIGGVVIVDGVEVDLAVVRNGDELYGNELKKKTEGIQMISDLLVYFEGLEGDWASNRKKRKIVDARAFGNVLPPGWKLLLCLKRRGDRGWLDCTGYISPNGKHFMSCKEVCSYLFSISGLQDPSKSHLGYIDSHVQLTERMPSLNASELANKNNREGGDSFRYPVLPSSEQENQLSVLNVENDAEVQTVKSYKCHKCPISFDRQDDLMEHLLSTHHRSSRRPRDETLLYEAAVIKNGKYECQFCRTEFAERKRYYSHLGNHIKAYLKRINNLTGDTSTQKSVMASSVGISSDVTTVHGSVEIDRDSHINTAISTHDDIPSIEKLRSLEVYSSVPSNDGERDGVICNIDGQFTIPSSFKDRELICNRMPNSISSANMNETKCNAGDRVGGSELAIGPGNHDIFPVEESPTNNDQVIDYWSFSVSPSWNDHIFLDENSKNGTTKCTVRKPLQRKEPGGGSLTSSVGKQSSGFVYDAIKASSGNMDLAKCDNTPHFKNSECSDSGLVLEAATNFELHNGSNRISSVPRANAQNFVLKESGDCISSQKNRMEDRFSQQIDFLICDRPSDDGENNEKKSSLATVGNKHEEERFSIGERLVDGHDPFTAQDANAEVNTLQDGHPWINSLVSLPNQRASANSIANVHGSNKGELKQKHGFYLYSGNNQVCGIENSFNKGLTGMNQEQSEYENLGHLPREAEVIVGCHSHTHPDGITISQSEWRTDQGNALPNASSCFPTHNIISDKGETEILGDNVNSLMGIEALTSGSVDNVGYDFLTSKESSHSGKFRVFSYDVGTAQEFDSAFWLEKEYLPLFPDKPSRPYGPRTCAWCSNEYQNATLEPKPEIGAVGSLCADCKAKFNGQLKFL